MLAHQVHHGVHGFHAVERRPAPVGRRRGMRRHAAEPELARHVGQAARRARCVAIARMHRHHRVHVVEEARAQHVDLARAALLRRRAVEADGAAALVGRQPVLHRDGRRRGGRAEQVMAAAVARALGDQRIAVGHGGLRQARQRVELADDADHRLAAAPGGREGRGNLGHARRHREAGGLQLLLQQRAALRLLVAHFGERPDLHGHIAIGARLRVDGREHGIAIHRLRPADLRRAPPTSPDRQTDAPLHPCTSAPSAPCASLHPRTFAPWHQCHDKSLLLKHRPDRVRQPAPIVACDLGLPEVPGDQLAAVGQRPQWPAGACARRRTAPAPRLDGRPVVGDHHVDLAPDGAAHPGHFVRGGEALHPAALGEQVGHQHDGAAARRPGRRPRR